MAGRLFRRNIPVDGPSAASPAPGSDSQHTADVLVLTAEGSADAEILAGEQRVSDVLNSAEPLLVRAPAPPYEQISASWIEIDEEERDEIVAVLPPDRPFDPRKRLHRQPQEVRVRIGQYLISGNAHVPFGAEATGFLIRHSPHFVPLTEATIRHGLDEELKAPVVIVNLRAADGLTSKSLDPDETMLGTTSRESSSPF